MAHRPTEVLGHRKCSIKNVFIKASVSHHFIYMSPFKPPPAPPRRNLDRNVYALRLDNSVDVSVVLQDMRPGSGSGPVTTLDLKEIFSKTPSSAPGKFYNSEAGGILLGTLKTGGPCARVELMPGEDEEHEQNWEKFSDRLENKHAVGHVFAQPF